MGVSGTRASISSTLFQTSFVFFFLFKLAAAAAAVVAGAGATIFALEMGEGGGETAPGGVAGGEPGQW